MKRAKQLEWWILEQTLIRIMGVVYKEQHRENEKIPMMHADLHVTTNYEGNNIKWVY